ncbi:pentapeptide repeat-containing protein [Aliarcobacter butzleri]
MIEAFGFIADIFLFGIAITIYEIFWKKKETITRYLEELEDYRGWNEKEASYRVFGLIKRLHKLNKTDIDLSNCYFEEVPFSKNSFNGFDFKESLLYGTKFKKCNLQLSVFNNIQQKHIQDFYDYCTVIEKTIFNNCNLRDSKFMNNLNFFDLHFLECDMKNANLFNSGFLWCNFKAIDFHNANFEKSKFKSCVFEQIDFNNLKLIDMECNICKFISCKNVDLIKNNINPEIIIDINEINMEIKQ